MNTKPLFAIGVLALAISQVAYAKDDDKKKSKDTETLDEVTVSAEGVREELLPESPKNAYRLPVSAANITQTITREQIQQFRPRDVFQLLDNATGVIATQGSRKGFSGLTIRGDSNFRYIVDGAYLQPNMASRMMASLPVMAIEEVKIVRGGSALTMGPMSGSASPGGAPVDGFIIIRTRKTTKDGGQARVAGESFDGVKGDLMYGKTFGDQEDKGYVQGLISHQRTDGPGQPLDTPQTGPGTSSSFNRSSIRTDGMFKGGYEGNGLMVDFMAFKDDSSFGIPNANIHGSGSGNWKMAPSRTEIYAMNASYSWDDIHTTLINASHSTNKQHFNMGGGSSDKENINEVTHLNVRHNMDIDKTRVMVGGDFMHWDAPNGQQYYEGIQREEDTLGWFAQVEQKFFDDKLTLDGSYRGDKVDVLHGLDYYAGGSQPPGGVNSSLKTTNKTLPTATFFNVGAGYEFIKNWKLIGRYGETDVSSSGMNVTAGTQLKEQHQIKAEIGIQGQVTSWFNPAVNYFHRDAQNELNLYGYSYDKKVGNVTSHVTCQAANATSNVTNNTTPFDPCYSQSNTVRDGFEVTSTGQIGSNTNYNFGWTSYTKLNSAALGTTARNQVNMSFGHRFDVLGENFNLTGAFKYLPKYKGSQSDAGVWSGGYTRYDFGLGHDFKLAQLPLTATVYGQNLTDERFETNSGVQDVGRVVGIEFISSF
jgi:iron complex outermembrane receptor protein